MFSEDSSALRSVSDVQVLLGAALPARACDGGGVFYLSKVSFVNPWPPQGHVCDELSLVQWNHLVRAHLTE